MQAIGKLIFLRLFCNTLLVVLCFKQRKRERGDDANVYFLNQTFSKCIIEHILVLEIHEKRTEAT